jgi:hypothetical protein
MAVVIDPGHLYGLAAKQKLFFMKSHEGEQVYPGTTNEEILEVLLDRTTYLNEQFPCTENEIAILGMQIALKAFNQRTKARIAQGVQTKDVAHVS